MSEAGIIILPDLKNVDEVESLEDSDVSEPEEAPLKWPRKSGTHSDLFDSEDSWFDATPEGFNLTVNPWYPFSYYYAILILLFFTKISCIS